MSRTHLINTISVGRYLKLSQNREYNNLVIPEWFCRGPASGDPPSGIRHRGSAIGNPLKREYKCVSGSPPKAYGDDKLGCNSSSLTFMRWLLVVAVESKIDDAGIA